MGRDEDEKAEKAEKAAKESAESLRLMQRVLALRLHVPVADVVLLALSVAFLKAAARTYRVAAHGWGSSRVYFERHWQKPGSAEYTDPADPEYDELRPKGR